MMRLARPRLRTLFMVLACLLLTSMASGDGRTDFLIGRLKAEDFRVRTNAALALGATNDESAVTPLCQALGDSSDVVRQSAAVALKRLARPTAIGCLKNRLASEQTASVKLQISRAISSLETSDTEESTEPAAAAGPKTVANAKYYVAISAINNNTGRPQPEIDRVVGAAIRSKLDALGGYQIAPDKETPAAARAAITKRKLKGYYLSIGVDKFDYSDGNLRVKVKVAVFTYPGKDLRGEVPAGLTQTGVRPGDKGAEDNLMNMAAERAIELFVQNFP
jgi:hypothetical protein